MDPATLTAAGSSIASQGILGALLVIAFGVIVFLFKRLEKALTAADLCNASRLTDVREILATVAKNDASFAAMAAAIEALNRMQEERAKATIDLTRSVMDLKAQQGLDNDRFREKLDAVIVAIADAMRKVDAGNAATIQAVNQLLNRIEGRQS
jgi:hypothetical protein